MSQHPKMDQIPLSNIGLLFILFIILRYAYKSRLGSLKFVRGPLSPSWLFGNEYDIVHQLEVGKLETPWFKEYGLAFRYTGCFGEEILYVADPKALQHILHASSYHYSKTNDSRNNTRRLFGQGVLWAEGNTHQRHRKALNPAFSASQLKTFLSLFQQETQRLANKWQEQRLVQAQDSQETPVIDITKWISRLTLDIIGKSAFEYDFQALDARENKLASTLRSLFKSNAATTKLTVLIRAFRRNLTYDPTFHNPLNPNHPLVLTNDDERQNRWLEVSNSTARDILRQKGDIGHRGAEKGDKDILSVLVRSNALEDPKKRLSDEEVLAQMSTMILAGHETTGSTSVWMFYELARHPDQQQRVWQEINEVRKKKLENGEEEGFTAHDYDSMPFFNAFIKEVLRFYPIVIGLFRNPDRDDVIPLAEPIISSTGQKMAELPVKKGQRIHIHIPTYNRLKSVWGEDADTWNPERFLDEKKGMTLGVYANLLTFSGGVRSCIGWRFALLELQSILEGLVSNFEFSIDPSIEIMRAQAGVMQPLVRGKEKEGLQMPLKVKRRTLVGV